MKNQNSVISCSPNHLFRAYLVALFGVWLKNMQSFWVPIYSKNYLGSSIPIRIVNVLSLMSRKRMVVKISHICPPCGINKLLKDERPLDYIYIYMYIYIYIFMLSVLITVPLWFMVNSLSISWDLIVGKIKCEMPNKTTVVFEREENGVIRALAASSPKSQWI